MNETFALEDTETPAESDEEDGEILIEDDEEITATCEQEVKNIDAKNEPKTKEAENIRWNKCYCNWLVHLRLSILIHIPVS